MSTPIRNEVFFSYSHRDGAWLERLRTVLAPLIDSGQVEVWHDEMIRAGERWRDEIRSALKRARVAVLLVSPDFLASPFIRDEEMPAILEAAQREGLTIFWVPLKDALYEVTELQHYQAAQNPHEPLTALEACEQDRALVTIARKIHGALGEATLAPQPPAPAGKGETRTEVQFKASLNAVLPPQYRIGREIGRGPSGIVYQAEDTILGRKVAIKALATSTLENTSLEPFDQAVRNAAGFRHPSIVAIYEARLDCVPRYFVMEFVDGRSLRSILETDGPLPPSRVQEILSDVGSALAYAHWKGFIHQNIMTANIMVDGRGHAVISAFGITDKVKQEQVKSRSGRMRWELFSYLSPEQFYYSDKTRVTAAADQYLLGLVAYEMLTGSPPIRVRKPADFAQMHAFFEAPTPIAEVADCAPELARTIMRMLEKEPERRFPSMEAAVLGINVAAVPRSGPRRPRVGWELLEAAKASYRRACGDRAFYVSFYRRFFNASPEAEHKFARTDLERQYDLLHEAVLLLLVFPELDDTEPTILTRLARLHARGELDVPPHLYDAFVDALVANLAEHDPEFCDRVEAAWRATLRVGVEYMKSRYDDPA